MTKINLFRFWSSWGLIPRLMAAVGGAVIAAGGVQTALLVAEGAAEHSARLRREQTETLVFLAPLVADQALVGDYEAVSQLLKGQVKKAQTDKFIWTDRDGKQVVAADVDDKLDAPKWFVALAPIPVFEESVEVSAGGVGYGTLACWMTPVKSYNRLWQQFTKQLQILAVTLFLMLQFIWLIFRGNLGTLRMLAVGANRFSQGEHGVRITPEGAPEVGLAAEAFNNMANNIEGLISSLAKSESKSRLLATIVEQSSEAIWTTDLAGNITSWNAGAAAMFGYGPAEAIGHALKVTESTPEAEQERLQRLAKGEKFAYDAKAMTASGGAIDIQVALAPLLDEGNRSIGRIAVARDVTQTKRSEEALRFARETAEAANQAKSSFLARMSHEIRTPMNGVLGMTELLLETGLTSTQRKYAETVQRSGKNLLGIINDLLDFSKIEAGKLELETVDMDLRRTIEDIAELLAERAHAKGLDIACSIPPGLITDVRGDPLRLGQVLTNLVGNAIKFTEKGGVVVRVSAVAQAPESVTMRFEVKDTGIGISRESQGRIFKEFSQADGSTTRKHGGSGLGLAISKELVEMMGGEIRVESEAGVGSTFWFTATFERQAMSREGSPALIGRLTGVRALIVDANAVSSGILRAQISNWEMTAWVAETPKQAIDLLAQAAARGAPYDVALIDLRLPGMDAEQLAATIRGRADMAKVRLIMLTRRHVDAKHARDSGFDACLVKPVRQTALYDCLVNVMAGRSTEPAPAPVVHKPTFDAPAAMRGEILLVEDNVINQQVALGILQIRGYSVTIANNGREALDMWARHNFDLILMDCAMPEMDGYEATREIRTREQQSGKRVPIVALTANAMAHDRDECLSAGMDDHLAKPFSMQAMQEMLDRWIPASTVAVPRPAERAKRPAKQVLDRQVLDELSKMLGNGKTDMLASLINLYLAESPKLVDELKVAANAGDAREIARVAHSLKSCSANVGAMALSRYCAELLTVAKRGDANEARRMVATLESEYASVQEALSMEFESLSATKEVTSNSRNR